MLRLPDSPAGPDGATAVDRSTPFTLLAAGRERHGSDISETTP